MKTRKCCRGDLTHLLHQIAKERKPHWAQLVARRIPPPPVKVTGKNSNLVFLAKKTLMLKPSLLNGKDNLLISTVAPVIVPDSLPPRHQTLSPLLPRHLLVFCTSLGAIQEILLIVILSLLPPQSEKVP